MAAFRPCRGKRKKTRTCTSRKHLFRRANAKDAKMLECFSKERRRTKGCETIVVHLQTENLLPCSFLIARKKQR